MAEVIRAETHYTFDRIVDEVLHKPIGYERIKRVSRLARGFPHLLNDEQRQILDLDVMVGMRRELVEQKIDGFLDEINKREPGATMETRHLSYYSDTSLLSDE
jgi:hypothetical protein